MKRLLAKFKMEINPSVHLKDPESSDLGKSILQTGIRLIHDHGFEDFTFRKLGQEIQTTETSIYRYFENKQTFLLYLTCWYWGWLEYRLVFETANVSSPQDRLRRAVSVCLSKVEEDFQHPYIDIQQLSIIVKFNSAKSYFSSQLDDSVKSAVFEGYRVLVDRVATIIREINPDYKFPNMLVSTVIEAGHFQQYFMEHMPLLVDKGVKESSVVDFYSDLILKTISS